MNEPLAEDQAEARTEPHPTPRIVAVIMAAGASSRMSGKNKLLRNFRGRPLVSHVAAAAQASSAMSVMVVLGHRAAQIKDALPSGVLTVLNEDPSRGLSSSLVIGIGSLPDDADGALIMLGDMPLVTEDDCDALIRAGRPDRVTVPVVGGRRGNPVLWHRLFFQEMLRLTGDRGARTLLERYPDRVTEVALQNAGLLLDIDTQPELDRARQQS